MPQGSGDVPLVAMGRLNSSCSNATSTEFLLSSLYTLGVGSGCSRLCSWLLCTEGVNSSCCVLSLSWNCPCCRDQELDCATLLTPGQPRGSHGCSQCLRSY